LPAGIEFKQRDYDARGTRLQPFALSSGMRILRMGARHGRDPCHYFLVAASPLSPFVVSKPSLHRAGFSRFIEN